MHPATATTPFTLLWASIEKSKEAPPRLSFAALPRAQTQQPSNAPITTPPTKASSSKSGTRATAQPADARTQSAANPARNERAANAFTTSDFLVTNLRPDLLD